MIAQSTLQQKIEANRQREAAKNRDAMLAKSQAAWDQEDQEILAEIQSGNASPAFIALYGPQVGIYPDPTPEPPAEIAAPTITLNTKYGQFTHHIEAWRCADRATGTASYPTWHEGTDAHEWLDYQPLTTDRIKSVVVQWPNQIATIQLDNGYWYQVRYTAESVKPAPTYANLPSMGGGAHTAAELNSLHAVSSTHARALDLYNDLVSNPPSNIDADYLAEALRLAHDNATSSDAFGPSYNALYAHSKLAMRGLDQDYVNRLQDASTSVHTTYLHHVHSNNYNNLPPMGGGSHTVQELSPNRATSQKRDNERAERHAINEAYHANATTQAADVAAILTEYGLTIIEQRESGDTPVTIWRDEYGHATIKQTPYTLRFYNGTPAKLPRHGDAELINRIQHGWCLNGEVYGRGYSEGLAAALLPLLETPDPLMEALDAQEAYTELYGSIQEARNEPTVILTGGQPTMTGPWADTSDPYSNLPAIGGGSQENDTEDDMIATTYTAEQLAAAFYNNDIGKTCIKDDNEEVAEIVRSMVFAADQSGLGWDFAYIAVSEALDHLANNDIEVNDDIDTHDFADQAVSVYNADLIRWLNDAPLQHFQLCDEAKDEFGGEFESIIDWLKIGQYHAYELAMQAVISNWPEA